MEAVCEGAIGRRAFIASAFLFPIALSGCNNEGGSSEEQVVSGDQDTLEEQGALSEQDSSAGTDGVTKTKANIGDELSISTEYGDLAITVEGFGRDSDIAEKFASDLDGGIDLGQLLLKVENVSYGLDGDTFIDLSSFMYVEGDDGVSLNEFAMADDVGQYAGTPGLYLECLQGQTKRVAVFLTFPRGLGKVTVVVGDYEIETEIDYSS